jgi:hypothetical protein
MSDPAGYAPRLSDLPADIAVLQRVIQGLLVHSEWLTEYGLDPTRLRGVSRETLPVAQRLANILALDAQPLHVTRAPERRAVGTCRDFALMLCAMLRSKGIPARVRCGFAAYFHTGWEDHWVCEYWDRATQAWRLSDPQLDAIQQRLCHVAFDTTDVPRDAFVTAGQAWLDCRANRVDPNRYGHGDVTGLWFVQVNVMRDHYVINNRETSVWDSWRAAPSSMRIVKDADIVRLDAVAAAPERPFVAVTPDWLA